jgi:hypothetical protein
MKNVRVTRLGVAALAVLASALVLAVWGTGAVKDIGIAVVGLVMPMFAAQLTAGGAVGGPEAPNRDAKKRRFGDGR